VDGPPGSGKSSALLQIASALRSQEKGPLLYLKDLGRWTAGYYPYYHKKGGLYEQPELAREIFQTLLLQNPSLSSLSETITSLEQSLDRAVPLLQATLAELQELTLIIDDINALYLPETAYRSQESKPLSIESLPVLSTIRTLLETTTGRVLVATNRSDPLLQQGLSPFLDHVPSTLTKVPMDPLNSKEIALLPSLAGREEMAAYMQFVTGGNGSKLPSAMALSAVFRRTVPPSLSHHR